MNEHIKFITVGFADLINSLPNNDVNCCTECGRRIPPRAYWHSTPTALLPFCDEWCFSDWGQDRRLDDDAEYGLDYRDE